MLRHLGRNFCFRFYKYLGRSLATRSWQEVSIPVPWGEIRGKWWGPTHVRPILTLHGWQDNCGSHDRLIPLLNKDVGFLAIDLPGHGYSSQLPAGIYYHVATTLVALRRIKRHFDWPTVSFMGHSLGGTIAYTYTMFFPDEVDFCICIEGAKPWVLEKPRLQIAKYLENFDEKDQLKEKLAEPPSYSLEEIKQKTCNASFGSVSLKMVDYLIERGVAPSKIHPDRFYFTRDPKIKSFELTNFSQKDLLEYTRVVRCPVFIAKISHGSFFEEKENFYEWLEILKKSSRHCDFHHVEGDHHVHLNNPEELAILINKFLDKHLHETNRTIGGLNDKDIVRVSLN